MNHALRKMSFFIGFGLLIISMYFNQDGFNFDIAGENGYKTIAVIIGWFLAITVNLIEFIFSSNFKELNPSLILFGIMAYGYSIYTNYLGILHFQGTSQNSTGALVLGVFMDALAEPMIAWSLYESRGGDFIGNIVKSIGSALKALSSAPDSMRSQNQQSQQSQQSKTRTFTRTLQEPKERQEIRSDFRERLGNNGQNKGNQENQTSFQNLHRINSEKPNRHNLGE